MDTIVVVCGKWICEKNGWMFNIDQNRGSKIIAATKSTKYEDFMRMVIEDYKIERRFYDVEFSYMFSKKLFMKLPQNTPPVEIDNSRQLHIFLDQQKTAPVRLCIELKLKVEDEGICSNKNNLGNSTTECERQNKRTKINDKQHEVNLREGKRSNFNHNGATCEEKRYDEADDNNDRFDYCDDTDGATSDDEDFCVYASPIEEIHEKLKPIKNMISTANQQKRKNTLGNLDLCSLSLVVGQQYASKVALETKLKILSVVQKFDFNVDRSRPHLLVVKCWVEGCTWRVRASPIGNSPQFTIRVYVAEHTCSVTARSARCRQATPDILALLYKDLVGGVGAKVLPCHVAEALTKRFGIKVEYWKARRTLLEARNLVCGSPESGYEELPTYLYMIRRANPGTFTRLEVDNFQRFKYLFIAFGASMNGFPFMRKVVVVDGTFLKGKYKGTLLTASAQDGNFHIFPIAFAVVDTENDESWEWFFRQLNYVIPDDEGLALISDRHKSIANAIGKVYPMAARGVCTYHLYKNILSRFRGSDVFRLVKKAANSYRLSDFEATFDEIKALNPALHKYLQNADVRKWTRVHFPGDRYNITTTNIAESLNKVLSDARGLPIVQLLDAVRLMMTRWFSDRRNAAGKMQTVLTRRVEKILEDRVPFAKSLKVQAIDEHQSQVSGVSSLHVVNLTEKKCSCRRFDLVKIPCVHAIAAAEARGKSCIDLCHVYYYKNYMLNAYSTSVMPTDDAIPIIDHVKETICLPPLVRQPPGRPKNSRVKSVLEKTKDKKTPRKQHTCSRCSKPGHNFRTCKADV